jgi:homopolymeric O-antigen transport system ATP-binding protein
MRPILQVRNLGKQYRVRSFSRVTPTLREAFINAAKVSFYRRNGRKPDEEDLLWVLKDISFDVLPGEVVGIIGRNGAGKSTLLKILSRIIKPTAGYVNIYGRVGSLLEIGTGFHPDLTGRENIYLNGAIIGMRREEIKRKFEEIVAFAEIERFLETPVKYYSSGMYVRLAFAVAAHFEPEILILDEVLAVGDAAFRDKCLTKMREVSGEGRTVFYVSHDLMSIQQLCGRLFLIEGGRLLEDGEPGIVTANYLRIISSAENLPVKIIAD